MSKQPSEERGCVGKIDMGINYKRIATHLSLKHNKQYGVYQCPHCKGTHLTTKLHKATVYATPLLFVTPAQDHETQQHQHLPQPNERS